MARPPGAEAPRRPVRIRLSPLELRRAVEAAHVCRITVGEFIRDAILEASNDCLEAPPKLPRLRRPPPL